MRLPSIGLLYAYAATSPAHRAAIVLGIATATLSGAWFSELVLGYVPCKLCLIQRWPYYFAIPLAALALLIAGPMRKPFAARPAFAALAMIFMFSAALGLHHAGVEYGWWAGPADCAGKLEAGPANAIDLMAAMQKTRIVSCTEASLKVLGFSLAGWNALISFLLATLSIRGWRGSYGYRK